MDYEFYAQIGDVSTTTPWRRPTLMSVTDWWKEFSFEVGLEDYNVWLVGSFMERLFGVYDGFPNDLDVVLTGDIPSYPKLKKLLNRGIEIGFEKRLLVDIFWSSDVFHPHLEEFKPFSLIRAGKTFIKHMNGEVYQSNFGGDEEYTLPNGLTQFVYYEPTKMMEKVQLKKDMGSYIGIVVNARDLFE